MAASTSTNIDERLAEEVRKYPVLYDKSCPDFKDRKKKELAWQDVGKSLGLENGEEAKTMFRYLRNRYSRDKKKIEKKKVSGTGTKDVDKAKCSASDLYLFMSWLDPYVKPRASRTNVFNVETNESEEEEEEETKEADEDNDIGHASEDDSSSFSGTSSVIGKIKSETTGRMKFRKKPRKSDSSDDNQELQLLKEIGSSLIACVNDNSKRDGKDEDSLFSELLASQLRKIETQDKLVIKMKINQIMYEQQLKAINSHLPVAVGTPQPTAQDTNCGSASNEMIMPNVFSSLPKFYVQPQQVLQSHNDLYPPGYFFRKEKGFLEDLNNQEQ